jgi:hypothetical protein
MHSIKRPIGVTLLALVFLWIGCLGSLFFPLFLFSGLTRMMWNQTTAGVNQSQPWLRFIVQHGAYPFSLLWWLFYMAYACIGFGLWKLRNWARQAVLGLTIFSVTVSLLLVPFLVRPAALAFATITGLVPPFAWLVWYLNRPRVRFAFGALGPMESDSSISELPRAMSTWGKIFTAAAVMSTFAMFVCSVLFAVQSMFRQSQVYRITLGEAERSPCVAARVGNPFQPGWMVSGNMQESNTEGSAHLEIPVVGAKGKASLVVSAQKKDGVWKVDELVLVQKGKEIRLIPDDASPTCE